MKNDRDFTGLLATIAARQDEELAREKVVETARERLLVGRPVAGGARRRRILIGTFAVAAVLLLFLFARPLAKPRALAFDVDGIAGAAGGWIGAPSAAPLPVRFSNGASVILAAGSRARIASVSPHGAVVQLERGRLHVAVPHEPETEWRFGAGPYDVKVIGTQFDVAWDADGEAFEIRLLDGVVEVRGPKIDGVRRVARGESLRLTAEPIEAPAAQSADAPLPPEPPAPPSAAPAPAEPPAASTRRALPASPDWVALARDGSYRDAFSVASRRGFDGEVSRANAADLLLLGDASRYAGDAARARQCYLATRARFPGSLEAARGSFRLGVLVFPSTSALPLFEQFLREQPEDPLASEALGRILEVDDKAGDVEAARAAAGRYLAKYPDGAHARLAHGILGR